MSVNSTVASIRVGWATPRTPVRNRSKQLQATDQVVRLRWTASGSNHPQELTVLRETFDRLAQDRDMKTVLLSAITAERERQGSPRRPGGRAVVAVGVARWSTPVLSTPASRITDAEKSYVREHKDQVNRRLRGKGMRTIDANDPTMRKRYGLLEQIRY
jgi:hypothetical protein